MSANTNHWKLGLFVVLGVGIGLGTLGWLGADTLDQKVEPFEMYFDEPVDGLSVGSEVRYRGMPIGSVARLSAAPDRIHVHVHSLILIRTLEDLGIRDRNETQVDVDARIKRLREGVDGRVLRAQIERNPLTGMAVINVDFYPKELYPLAELPFEVDHTHVLPTRPSVIKGILANMDSTLQELGSKLPVMIEEYQQVAKQIEEAIRDLQIRETGDGVRATLASVRKAIQDLQLGQLSGEASTTMSHLREALDEIRGLTTEMRRPDSNLNKLLVRYEALGSDVQRAVGEAKLGESTAAARKMMGSVTGVSDEAGLFVSDLRRELITVTQTLDAIRRLADLLERDPSALIRGRTVRKRKIDGGR